VTASGAVSPANVSSGEALLGSSAPVSSSEVSSAERAMGGVVMRSVKRDLNLERLNLAMALIKGLLTPTEFAAQYRSLEQELLGTLSG